jgi:hypothetical protein
MGSNWRSVPTAPLGLIEFRIKSLLRGTRATCNSQLRTGEHSGDILSSADEVDFCPVPEKLARCHPNEPILRPATTTGPKSRFSILEGDRVQDRSHAPGQLHDHQQASIGVGKDLAAKMGPVREDLLACRSAGPDPR